MKKKVLGFAFLLAFIGTLVFYSIESKANCTHGGPGSTSCSVSWSLLYGLFSGGCSTTCSGGYYACCHMGNNTCECLPDQLQKETV